MTTTYDLIVRNGQILDGSGNPQFTGDVAIDAGIIQAVGMVSGRGREEIDARGKLVTPGFVDIHTHYDGQVTWGQRLTPSSEHGVTTVVMGNCGVGFAPCRPAERNTLVKVMEGVEDIPEIVLSEGIPWAWESFPDYLDFLSRRRFDADCAAYLPHAAVRVFVMGARAARREPATSEDCDRMKALVTEAVRAGAIGVSTSRLLSHRDSDGHLAPHVQTAKAEVLALAQGLRDAGKGIFQIAASLANQQLKSVIPEAGLAAPEDAVREEVALLCDICRVSGRPVTFSLSIINDLPHMFRQVLDLVAAANRLPGINIIVQVFPRPIGILFGLDLSLNPFTLHPSYRALEHLPLSERVQEMRRPNVRARILCEASEPLVPNPVQRFLVTRALDAYPFGTDPDYEPDPGSSLRAVAAARGKSVFEVAYDALLERDGHAILFLPINNYPIGGLDPVAELLAHQDTVIGLGDGGAHCGLICDASYPSFVLTYWVRDRKKGTGTALTISEAVHRLTRRNALAVGLNDRGLLKAGMKADMNIIDYPALHLGAPEAVYDLPAAGRRITQRVTGIEATFVSGKITYRYGKETGLLPGRLVRIHHENSLCTSSSPS